MRANKRLGQHFLADRGAIRRIVEALDPSAGTAVLEIGPGRGALTRDLIASSSRIAAVEIDPELARGLRERFDPGELLLYERDALQLPFSTVLRQLESPPAARLRVAGNLPYNISKPVAMKLVDEHRSVDRAVLMFQREVADRLTAIPGNRRYGPLTVLCGRAYRISRLFHLGPAAFRPRPQVDSTVTLWQPDLASPPGTEELAALRRCLRACFASRRRTLRNNLRNALGSLEQVDALLERAALEGSLRPEAVDPAGYSRLSRAWPAL